MPDKTRILKNIILGSKTTNTGDASIALWSGKGTQPTDAHILEPDMSWIIPVDWNTTITVRNNSNDKKGKIFIKAIGEIYR